NHGINFHCYADDTQLYLSMKPDEIVHLAKIETCLQDVKSWMANNFLLLNSDKTEVMYIYQMQAMYNTCCFPSPSATQPCPHPPFLSPPGRPQADGFPLMCRGSALDSFLTNREFFLVPVAIVLALR